jgi:hypothetical protein
VTQVKGVSLTIEGRQFVQETPSFEQEMFIMEQAVEAGLDEATLKLTPDEKDLEPAIKRLLIQAYKSGALFRLMAALLTEEGVEWSEAEALKNAEIFRKTRDPESKANLRPATVAALIAFFESGVSSKQISSISSSLDADAESRAVSKNYGRGAALTPEGAGELFASGRMPPSSEKSLSTSTRSRKKSSA